MCFRWVVNNTVKPVKMYSLDKEAGKKMKMIIICTEVNRMQYFKARKNPPMIFNPLWNSLPVFLAVEEAQNSNSSVPLFTSLVSHEAFENNF